MPLIVKALAFNPLNANELKPREIETNFRVVDEFFITTSVGQLLIAEVWKDTEANREIIQKIIYQKQELKRIENEIHSVIYKLLNQKEVK